MFSKNRISKIILSVVQLNVLIIGFLIICFQVQAQWTIETVPDPKAEGLGYVSNPDGILTNEEFTQLNSIIAELEDTTTAQIAVVILKSIDDAVPKEFATELFQYWGIGNKETDNGLLILFVLDQRRIEFETGYGVEGILPDVTCYRIQQNSWSRILRKKSTAKVLLKE